MVPLALSLTACVGDDSNVNEPEGGTDAGADVAAHPDATADAPTEAPSCGSGLTLCNTTCVDLNTNTANCGQCAHDCGSDSACAGSACQVVTVATVDHPIAVAADDPAVFWLSVDRTAPANTTLVQCTTVDCTSPATLNQDFAITVANYLSPSPILLTNGTSLQWIAKSNDALNPSPYVFYCPIVNCNHTTTGVAENPDEAAELALSGTNKLFYRNDTGYVYSCPFGNCTDVTQGKVSAPSDQGPFAIAADATQFYYDNGDGYVFACPVAGCSGNPPALFAAGSVRFLAVNSKTVFAVSGSNIVSCDTGGCVGTPTTLTTNQPNVTALVADDAAVYFALGGTTGNADGEVLACSLPKCAGGPHPLATGLAAPNSLSLSKGVLYWSNGGVTGVNAVSGSIQKLHL